MPKAYITGAEAVMKWFEDHQRGDAYFSLWEGKQLRYSSDETDPTAAYVLLDTTIRPLGEAGVSDVFVLKLHPSLGRDGVITTSSPVYASVPFRPTDLYEESGIGGRVGRVSFPGGDGMRMLYEEMKAQRLQIKELQDKLGEEGSVSGIDSHPFIQLLSDPGIQGLISGIFEMIRPGSARQLPAPDVAINGVPTEHQLEKIDKAIEVLAQYDDQIADDLTRLANMAQTKPQMFNLLLQSLRADG